MNIYPEAALSRWMTYSTWSLGLIGAENLTVQGCEAVSSWLIVDTTETGRMSHSTLLRPKERVDGIKTGMARFFATTKPGWISAAAYRKCLIHLATPLRHDTGSWTVSLVSSEPALGLVGTFRFFPSCSWSIRSVYTVRCSRSVGRVLDCIPIWSIPSAALCCCWFIARVFLNMERAHQLNERPFLSLYHQYAASFRVRHPVSCV